jgi:hypothetical protein
METKTKPILPVLVETWTTLPSTSDNKDDSLWKKAKRLDPSPAPSGTESVLSSTRLFACLDKMHDFPPRASSSTHSPQALWLAECMTQIMTDRVGSTLKRYQKWLFQENQLYWKSFAVVWDHVSQTDDQLSALDAKAATCCSLVLLPLCLKRLACQLDTSTAYTPVQHYTWSLLENACRFVEETLLLKPIVLPAQEWMKSFLYPGDETDDPTEASGSTSLETEPKSETESTQVQEWTQLCLDVLSAT